MNIQNFANKMNAVNTAEDAGLVIAEFVTEVKTAREAAKAVAQLEDAGVPADDLQVFIQLLQEVTGWHVSVEMGRFYSDVDGFEAKANKIMADFDKEVNANMEAFEERSNARMTEFKETSFVKADRFFRDAKKLLG